jgi:hypothetical protein
MTLSRKERLRRQIRGEPVDRIPMLGGWNLGVRNVAAHAGLTVEEYLRDPWRGVIRANHRLGVDAVVPPIVPTDPNSIRDGALEEAKFENVEPETLLTRAEAIPDTAAKVLARFDAVESERRYRDWITSLLAKLDGIELILTVWEAPANFALYFQYGYEAFLAAVALYPEAVGRIYWEDSLLCRARNGILVRLMKELDLVPMLFCGHDICLNDGPMCAPEFLRQHYWPHARASLEPFIEADVRVLHHCDGNVVPLLDDMLGAGFSGFQGFQYECGVDPQAICQRRSARGEELLMMMGLSVTRTLPFGTPDDVREEVEYFLDSTDGGRGMFLFTSNVTGVEVPPVNIEAGYRHLAAHDPRRPRVATRRDWPWGSRRPGRKA